jgi:hypothetical protein
MSHEGYATPRYSNFASIVAYVMANMPFDFLVVAVGCSCLIRHLSATIFLFVLTPRFLVVFESLFAI